MSDRNPHLLVIDRHILTADVDGASLRMFNLLRVVLDLPMRVSFIPSNPADQHRDHPGVQRYVAALESVGVEVLTAPEVVSVNDHLAQAGQRYDIIMLSGSVHTAVRHFADVRRLAPHAVVWFDTLDLAHVREFRQSKLLGSLPGIQHALRTKHMELGLAAEADWTLVVSEIEQGLLESLVPGARVAQITNIHDVYGSARPFEQRSGLVFIGYFDHPPNLDAVRYFVQQVMPLLRPRLPGLRLRVVGSRMAPELLALACEDVEMLGYVPDLGPVYNSARLSIAPLRFGAGVKGKVLLSMGYGVPVVCTSMAAEGCHLVDGENALIANTPDGLAQAAVEAYNDRAVWQRLSDNGLETIRRHFSAEAARGRLERLVADSLALAATRIHVQ